MAQSRLQGRRKYSFRGEGLALDTIARVSVTAQSHVVNAAFRVSQWQLITATGQVPLSLDATSYHVQRRSFQAHPQVQRLLWLVVQHSPWPPSRVLPPCTPRILQTNLLDGAFSVPTAPSSTFPNVSDDSFTSIYLASRSIVILISWNADPVPLGAPNASSINELFSALSVQPYACNRAFRCIELPQTAIVPFCELPNGSFRPFFPLNCGDTVWHRSGN